MSTIVKRKCSGLLVFGAVVCAALPAYAGFEYIPPIAPSAVVPPDTSGSEMSGEPGAMPSVPAPVIEMAPIEAPVKNQIIMEDGGKEKNKEAEKPEVIISAPAPVPAPVQIVAPVPPAPPSAPAVLETPSVSTDTPDLSPLPVPPPPARALEVPPVSAPSLELGEPMLSSPSPVPAENKKPLSLKERLFGKTKTLNPVAVPGRSGDERTQKPVSSEEYSKAPDLGDLGFERPEKTKNFATRSSSKEGEGMGKISITSQSPSSLGDSAAPPHGLISQTVMVPSKEQKEAKVHEKKVLEAPPPPSAPAISTAKSEEEAIARAEANRKANILPPPAPTEPPKVTVKETEEPISEKDQVFGDVTGFGRDLPLALAVTQVVPADYRYIFASGVDAGSMVSWQGGKPWDQVLKDMVAPVGLKAEIRGKEVSILPAK